MFLNDSTLTFSSDGLGGFGGLDIFSTIFAKGNWSDPVHLAYPFNSQGDDFSLFSQDNLQSGYITSNRNEASGNEDIYYFEKKNKCTILAGLYNFHEDKMVTSLPYDIIENQKLKENLISLENGMVYHELKDGTNPEITTSYLGKSFYSVASSDECNLEILYDLFSNTKEKEMATLGKVFEEETKIDIPMSYVYLKIPCQKKFLQCDSINWSSKIQSLLIDRFYHYIKDSMDL